MDAKGFMTIQEFKYNFFYELQSLYGRNETESFCFLLLEHYLGLDRLDLVLNNNRVIENDIKLKLQDAVTKLKAEIPIQYILGKTHFYGLPFKVNSAVLIPRPETEELVDWIVSVKKPQKENYNILDIGTGSGCIAISLAKFLPFSNVTALDVSNKALKVAKENASLNNVKIDFIEHDILMNNLPPNVINKKFSVIVSNPPYVRESEKAVMSANVLNNEPESALYVTDGNPLIFYSYISDFAINYLSSEGMLYFEINEAFGEEVVTLLRDKGFEQVHLRRDIYGKDRMIEATKS